MRFGIVGEDRAIVEAHQLGEAVTGGRIGVAADPAQRDGLPDLPCGAEQEDLFADAGR